MSLQDAALRLSERDRQFEQMAGKFRKNQSEEFVRVLDRYVKLRLNLQRRLLDEDVDPSAAFGKMDDAEVKGLGSDLFYSWYSHYEYVEALTQLRPSVPGCDVWPTVRRLVGGAKQCYAFQQYDAASPMCRVFLEASARDFSERLGLIRASSNSRKDSRNRPFGKVARELGVEESFFGNYID